MHWRHGMSKSREYRVWASMRNRCRNARDRTYKYYGGRGISICPRWDSFANFLADMGERPEGTTLDRIDVDGNYEPGNCRWADAKTQRRNARHTKLPEWDARMIRLLATSGGLRVVDIARMYGVSPSSVVSIKKGRIWELSPAPERTQHRGTDVPK